MTSTGIAAGWYDDGSGTQRWWDGSGWTEHVARPIAAATAVRPRAEESGRPSIAEVFAAKMREAELRATASADSPVAADPDDTDVDADEFLAEATPIASRRAGFTAVAPHERLLGTAADLNTELGRLAAFRAQGVLDDAEFAAAKRRLLGL